MAYLVIPGQTVRALLWRSARKFGDSSRSLRVIGSDMDRSAICEFLLVFRVNYGPISYHFRDKWRYLPNFPTPLYLTPSPSGFRLEFCNGVGVE